MRKMASHFLLETTIDILDLSISSTQKSVHVQKKKVIHTTVSVCDNRITRKRSNTTLFAN